MCTGEDAIQRRLDAFIASRRYPPMRCDAERYGAIPRSNAMAILSAGEHPTAAPTGSPNLTRDCAIERETSTNTTGSPLLDHTPTHG